MFKPSLRKSILNENLCLISHAKTNCFGTPVTQKPRPVVRVMDNLSFTPTISLPSMMIPQQILQKHESVNNNQYTHLFTPLSYDFKPYPKAVKQIISPNPKSAQAGRINQINYVIYEKNMLLWKSNNDGKESQLLKIHKFKQKINIAAFSVLRNQKMFRKQKVTILAVSFQNRIKLFKVDQKELNIQDIMIKYQLKSCRFIQKIHFTEKNEIVFAGDSGQFSMISFNGTKQLIVKIKSSIIKKYLSKSAFDYFTRHVIRQIQVTQKFLYCLHDRITKSNYWMYLLKRAMNKVVLLSEEPKYIHEETFIDIYKFTNFQRKQVVFVGQLKQKDVEKKIKEGYVNFWGQSTKDAFKIVSINAKGQQYYTPLDKQNLGSKQQKFEFEPVHSIEKNSELSQIINPVIQLTTKCGYVFKLIHDNLSSDKNSVTSDKQNFSFVAQPNKLPEKMGQASLFEPKVFISSPQEKEYRKNFVIRSCPIGKEQSLFLMNDSLVLNQKQQISLVKFDDLKLGLYQTTTEQEFYISEEQFNNTYQKNNSKTITKQSHQMLFSQRNAVYDRSESNKTSKYFRMFNHQKRWTVFDNEGMFHIYLLELKHIILAYLYYQCQFTAEFYKNSSRFDPNTNFMIECDLRLHFTLDKIIQIYGYQAFIKALVQILLNNSNDQKQYFYLQRDLFLEVIKRQFEFQLPNVFQDWSYGLGQHSQAQRIVPTDKMLQFIWLTLFQHQNKPILTSQTIYSQIPTSQYAERSKEYSEARSKLQYTAYGYALKSMFYETIEILIYFRAKQFKIKERQLKKCQHKLVHFFNFLQIKKQKAETQQYKNYLQMKKVNLTKKKQQNDQSCWGKNLNTTFSTTYSNSLNNTEVSVTGVDEQRDNNKLLRGVSYQSNQTLQRFIYKSIQKVISLIDVMNILIEKDQRHGLPSFIEIVTNFKNQIKIGQQFFNQELFISTDTVEFIHPELVKQVESSLPELQLQNKIDFLKFKIAKNIAFSNSLNQVDLKSLNFDKLSSLITSSEIPEVKRMFLGDNKDFNFQKTYFYSEFLSICLTKLIRKVKQLSSIKEQKFESLSQSVRPEKIKSSSLASHMTVQRIVLSQQQLQFYQEQMSKVFKEIEDVFIKSVQQLKTINGPQYYEAETYLQRMIELLTKNFGAQQILVQTLQIILRDANLIQKIHFMRKVKDRMMFGKDSQVQILKICREKECQLQEKSTFQYLMGKSENKMMAQQRTYDTWGSGSFR